MPKTQTHPRVYARIGLVALMTTTCITTPLFFQTAVAQAVETTSYSIPAQPLSAALIQFGRTSGIQIFFDERITTGLRSDAVTGQMTPNAAIARLLAGTGLQYQFTTPRTVSIVGTDTTADGTLALGTIVVGSVDTANNADAERAETYLGTGTSAYVSQEDILNKRGTSIGDVLSGIPGVTNAENRSAGALDVNIRGMQGQGRAPVVIDGAMQESTVYRGYAGMAGRTYIDPDMLGGLSIEKGPSTGPDAAGAIGGIVRARTLSPNDIIAPGGTWGARIITGFTGNNASPPTRATVGGTEQAVRNYNRPSFLDLRGYNTSGVLAYRFSKADFLVAYARRKNGNYFAGSDGRDPNQWNSGAHPFGYSEQVTNTSIDSKTLLLRSVIRPTDDHTFDLSYMRYDSLFGEMKPSQLMYGDTPYQTTSKVVVDTYTARYRYTPGNPLIDFRADLWATNVDSFVVDPVRIDYGDFLYNGDKYAAPLSERRGLTMHNTSRFQTGMGRVSLNYGVAFDREDFGKSKNWDRLNEMYPGRAWETREGYRNQSSAFATMEFKPADWATFTVGARYMHNVVQDMNAGSSWVQGGVINRDAGSGWTPAFSALIEPFQGVQFYTRYAEALRAASPFEATEGFTGSVNPYSNLKLEHAHNTEIGVNVLQSNILTADDLLQAKVGFFNNSVTNYITLGSERLTTPGGNSTDILVRTNIPVVEMRGFEFSGRYDMGRMWGEFGATKYTSVKYCFAVTPGRMPECHSDVDYTAQTWFTNHIPPESSFSGTLGARFLDEKLSVAMRYTNTKSDRPYETYDVFGSYRINDNAAVSVAVDNIFDKYYVDTLTLGRDMAMPASPGRTLRVSFIATLGDGDRSTGQSALSRSELAQLTSMSDAARGDFNGNWSGNYAGILWGGTHFASKGDTTAANGRQLPIATSEKTKRSTNAAVGGLSFGFNRQLSSGLVWGLEADASMGRARSEQAFISSELDNGRWGDYHTKQAHYRESFGPSATARVRLGKSFGRTLIYGTGGVAVVQEKLTRTQLRSTSGIISTPYYSDTVSKLRVGFVIGMGAEYAITNNMSMKAEYLYGHYSSQDFGFDRAGSSVFPAGVDDGTGRKTGSALETHNLRIGLNYRF